MNTSRGRPPQKTGLHRDLKTLAYIVTAPFSTQKLIRNVTSRNSQVLKKSKSGNGIYYQLLRADNLFS